MRRTLVIDVVGLTQSLLGDHTPNLNALIARGGVRALQTVTPAVTCTVQSTFTTGAMPGDHGCVANGWYFRDTAEVLLWRQSNRLVEGEKIWEAAKRRDPSFTCAKMFWWYNMYSSADYSVTPRPMYPADGRKLPDVYAHPSELRDYLTGTLGTFPLFNFWGPNADIVSSKWIADASVEVAQRHGPDLNLVYLPHLDYCLQKFGPSDPRIPAEVAAIDAVVGDLVAGAAAGDTDVIVLSEYGIVDVTGHIDINRVLRRAGHIAVREELGRELLDAGASDAFALADHQAAHVYVAKPELVPEIKALLESIPGIDLVLDEDGKREFGLDHHRSGELIALSEPDKWFTYYYWLDDDRAPDFARTVDIHRKPGFDPAEMFLDASLSLPVLQVGWRLLKKVSGMRYLMDVIGLDASVVGGSHGRITPTPETGPLFISTNSDLLPDDAVHACDVKGLILDHVFGRSGTGDRPLEQAG